MAIVFGIFIAFPVWAISDAATKPRGLWDVSGRSRTVWIAVQCAFWFFGSVVYVVATRPKLTEAGYP